MSTEIIRTAFDGVQQELGAEFMEWEGWNWTTDFGDAVAEHNAVRQDVGVWDESPLRKWDFSGPDALAAADRIFTNDMLGLEIGQVRYAPFCDENGKMVGDGTVFKFTDSSAWVITALDSDLDHMNEVVSGMNVSIEPITEKLPHVQLQGPRSREVLAGPRRRGRREPSATSASCRTRCTSAASPCGSPAPATPASSATSSSPSRTTPPSSGAS